MARKLFIVEPGNERLFRTLSSALGGELDVDIIYDRRKGQQPGRRQAEERRIPSDVEERIRTTGFAVVRPARHTRPGTGDNIRWSA